MLNQNFVFIGILINAIGLASYFIDTVKGKIQPNKVSFALWSIAPLVAFFAQVKQGVGIQSLMTLSVGLFPIIIFLGSFINKKAYWKITKFDLSCGTLSLIGLLALANHPSRKYCDIFCYISRWIGLCSNHNKIVESS